MAVYAVFLEETLTEDTDSIDLSMDYIAAPATSCRVYLDGLLQTLNADYTITNIIPRPYITTFTVNFTQTISAGVVLRVEKDEEWNQWIYFKFPQLEARIQALENKITAATNVATRLTALEAAVTALS